jgi:hypothetical protein|tara:strand:- start:114 stop:473 length:360 start_codon:yes stop_codon:yes gene_type:complete
MMQAMKLFQIQITPEVSKMVNDANDWNCCIVSKSYIEASQGNPKLGIQNKTYSHVATVVASNLEDAFNTCNTDHNVDRIERCDSMRSLSVGDIVETDDGLWFCDSIGWKEVTWDQYETI